MVKDRQTRLETNFQGVKGILQKLGSEAMVSDPRSNLNVISFSRASWATPAT